MFCLLGRRDSDPDSASSFLSAVSGETLAATHWAPGLRRRTEARTAKIRGAVPGTKGFVGDSCSGVGGHAPRGLAAASGSIRIDFELFDQPPQFGRSLHQLLRGFLRVAGAA